MAKKAAGSNVNQLIWSVLFLELASMRRRKKKKMTMRARKACEALMAKTCKLENF